ncbi:hypothetical protein EMIT0232MI5_30153 [Pseudomonas sp. IT-232MI5]
MRGIKKGIWIVSVQVKTTDVVKMKLPLASKLGFKPSNHKLRGHKETRCEIIRFALNQRFGR